MLQFDDGSVGHYTHAFRILEKYGLKGSFGVVTGVFDKPGRLTAEQVVEMHRAGHEIHDHTLDHNAAFWGNPEQPGPVEAADRAVAGHPEETGHHDARLESSRRQGPAWTPELRDTLAPHYDYVAGRVGLRPEEMLNIHWNLKDDPFCLGYGGVGRWHARRQSRRSQGTERSKTQIADGLQQGLVAIPLWHVINDDDGTAWGLEEICKFIRPTAAGDGHGRRGAGDPEPAEVLRRDVEQIPNPGFACDFDDNGGRTATAAAATPRGDHARPRRPRCGVYERDNDVDPRT